MLAIGDGPSPELIRALRRAGADPNRRSVHGVVPKNMGGRPEVLAALE
jgi:hypothetical protein